MIKINHKLIFFFLLPIFLSYKSSKLISETGEVYLVLGSDTAIWDGMNVGQFHCYYNIDLYTNSIRNAYQVMNPMFREQFLDSYGQSLKMTWWMMAGNIFRYATNQNVPLANTMTLYLMKKYHGDAIQQNEDELSLHYHTFAWTDYDGDGIYWWNQSLTFSECQEDFDITLAQFLIEENIFPISFRSGWHYMDNDWQQYLDKLLLYSMHNDWPSKHIDTSEPLDNIYDWSRAPQEFVPYHPATDDYQVPGSCDGWNVRSEYMGSFNQNLMDHIFEQANQGIDQVACIWAHLPETDFLQNIAKINDLAHHAADKYPDVKFRYCTAIESMQRWQGTVDTLAPELIIEEYQAGNEVYFTINTNEPIFQAQPFVAIKDIYEKYSLLTCDEVGENKWQTSSTLPINQLAKVGVAVCDTVGNLTTNFIHFLPDDIYIDNNDVGFVEEYGNWTTSPNGSWGINSRIATLMQNDSAKVKWIPDIQRSGIYNIFIQVPAVENAVNKISFKIYQNHTCIDTTMFDEGLLPMNWVYIGTQFLSEEENYLEMTAFSDNQASKIATADVAKFSALVRERDLYVEQQFIDFGNVSQNDTVAFKLKVANIGLQDLTLYHISSANNTINSSLIFPITITGMNKTTLPIKFCSPDIGIITDTLFITSNDPVEPTYFIPVSANVQSFFLIIDNEDSLNYKEEGIWYYSVAQAYGPTSRFSYLYEGPGANACFMTTLKRYGIYEIYEIVPKTSNATNRAVYIISISDDAVDSVVIDQNQNSGEWVLLDRYYLPAGLPIEIKVMDTGKSTSGDVLRADAIKFSLIQEFFDIDDYLTQNKPPKFRLEQNYPNPFNASTAISYTIDKTSNVELKIFNSLGQEVTKLVNIYQEPGIYIVTWNAKNFASGIYIYQLKTDTHCEVKKLILIN